jgi:FKBP-type peptidyl-prolyl cis-trans isomerase SlyD
MLTIRDDIVVGMEYTLRLDDGQVVDSSEGRGPLAFVQGKGNIIPGLEHELYGMAEGDEKEVVVTPVDGYGEFNSELLETLPRSVFPADMELEEGQGFRMRTDSGQVVVAYINSIEGDDVVVDLNHPLAGETLHFNVKIASLREATPEELAGGCSSCAGCSSECGEGDEDCEGGCACGCGADEECSEEECN